jgi:DNA-binding NarL/FixJ family response regulator
MLIRLDEAFCLLSERLKALAQGRSILVATANRPYALAMASAFAVHHDGDSAQLLGVVTAAPEALELIAGVSQPVLAFVSEVLEQGDGLALVGDLKALATEQRPIATVLTLQGLDQPAMSRALRGASDVVLTQRGIDLVGILHALDAIRQDQRYVDPMISYALQEAGPGARETLSEREVMVLSLVCRGLTNREIGEQLHIAETTARGHVQAIIRKLHVKDRTSAAVEAIRRHWVE